MLGYIENADSLTPLSNGRRKSWRGGSPATWTGCRFRSSGVTFECRANRGVRPFALERGRDFILEVWAFSPEFQASVAHEATRLGRAHLLGSKGPLSIAVGRTLTVSVTVPSFDVNPGD